MGRKNRLKIALGSICIMLLIGSCSYRSIKQSLRAYLSVQDHFPQFTTDAVYILGGPPHSTYKHVLTAADIYKRGATNHILIFSSFEKMDYDTLFQRNLTRNEWVIKLLVRKGVKLADIDTVPVKKILFGTMSEARAVTQYVQKKNYSSIIILSSPCHGRRLTIAFNHFLKSTGINGYVEASDDLFFMRELILEFIKVHVYRLILAVI
jgi:hypothetical protein